MIDRKLNHKWTQILITNACNLKCGGCNQLCGHFPKEKLWFISLDELKLAIDTLLVRAKEWWNQKDYPEDNKYIALYGGEPTLHPKWNEILDILYSYETTPFMIWTNGRTFPDKEKLPKTGYSQFIHLFTCQDDTFNHNNNLEYRNAHHKNVGYRIDYKDKNIRFQPTLVAPIDIFEEKNPKAYWRKAKKDCLIWNRCETIIYKNKAYYCTVAAAMDCLYHDNAHGWEIKPGENPFNKTEQEIAEQASHFCHRCGWCCRESYGEGTKIDKYKQFIHGKTLATETNYNGSKNMEYVDNLVQITIKPKFPPPVVKHQ